MKRDTSPMRTNGKSYPFRAALDAIVIPPFLVVVYEMFLQFVLSALQAVAAALGLF